MNVQDEIPDAPFYVVSIDSFMSGWGEAEGLTNYCVVPCANYDEAYWVAQYVKTRSEQRNIRLTAVKPKKRARVLYSVVSGWLDRAKEFRTKKGY